MNKSSILTICASLVGLIIIFSSVQASDSIVYGKLIVSVQAEKSIITTGDFPLIVGSVKDQAYKPISNAKVLVLFGTEIVTTTTDDQGNFKYQSAIPSTKGLYEIDVTASKVGYENGIGSATYMVEPQDVAVDTALTKTITGLPVQAGNYTVFLGKVAQWNLETTCFVDFSDKYIRFLKTCDLYNLAPEDFKTDQTIVPMVSVVQYNDMYRLFPESVYNNAFNMDNSTLNTYVAGTWANYTDPKP